MGEGRGEGLPVGGGPGEGLPVREKLSGGYSAANPASNQPFHIFINLRKCFVEL